MLKVFDAPGTLVATLISEDLQPGSYLSRWDASGMTSRVYFYGLVSGSHSKTRKLVLQR